MPSFTARVVRPAINASWLACAALALLIFLAAIPRGYALRFSGAGIGVPIDAPGWYVSAASVTQGVISMLAALLSLALAGIIFWKKRNDPPALFISFYLLAYGILMAGPLEALDSFAALTPARPDQSGMLISPEVISAIQTWFLTLPGLLLFYLFPSGRFVPPWTRYAALLALFSSPALAYIFAIQWTSPLTPIQEIVVVVLVLLFAAGVYAQIYRYRRIANSVEKQQTKWAVFGLTLNLLIMIVLWPIYVVASQIPSGALHPWWEPWGGVVWWIAMIIVPLSLAIAVMRYRLWDIDIIINRTLVYGSLTALIVGIYVLVVALVGSLFHATGNLIVSLLATGLITVLFQPLRERFQRGANRLVYGERDDPYAVLSRLGQRLDATLEPGAVFPTIVESVAQALKLPYAGIALKEGEAFQVVAEYRSPRSILTRPEEQATASSPSLQDGVRAIPLVHQSEVVGQLLVRPRAPGEDLKGADRHLLEQFALRAGIAVHALQLTRDLQHSRARLVTAREEERRRIRRNLHDGLGPVLASLAMQADNARESTRTDPAQTEAVLIEITAGAQGALQDIRRLVYDLRPPALDDLGLLGALRQVAANSPTGLHIELDAPDRLPPLSAAVEVAAYRITQEALNNVMRHSDARTCLVRICVEEDLELAIDDDGRGLRPGHRAGVGLISMRERATELGGSCIIESAPAGGTRVLARLPLAPEQEEDG